MLCAPTFCLTKATAVKIRTKRVSVANGDFFHKYQFWLWFSSHPFVIYNVFEVLHKNSTMFFSLVLFELWLLWLSLVHEYEVETRMWILYATDKCLQIIIKAMQRSEKSTHTHTRTDGVQQKCSEQKKHRRINRFQLFAFFSHKSLAVYSAIFKYMLYIPVFCFARCVSLLCLHLGDPAHKVNKRNSIRCWSKVNSNFSTTISIVAAAARVYFEMINRK